MSSENTLDLFDVDIEPRGRETSKFVFLRRPEGSPDFVRYSAPGVAGVAYLHRPALEHMKQIALEAVPNETIGMLCGRPCTDEEGNYTLVMAVERARPGEYVGTPGSVRISAAGRAALKSRAAQRWPGWEDVGWYHSHPRGEPRFSSTDFDEQTTLLAHQVGIVASVDRYTSGAGDPLGVYVGPAGDRLAGSKTRRALPAAPEAKEKKRAPKHFTPEVLKQIPIGVAVIVGLLLLSQVVTANWVRGAVREQYTPASIALPANLSAAAPRPRVITRTRRVVRLSSALIATRRCSVGNQMHFGVRVPQAYRNGLAVDALNPGVAAVSYDVATGRVNVDCLAVGNTVVEMRHGASGAAAAVVISVNDPVLVPQP